MSNITNKWTTIASVGFCGPVSRDENRAAHGGTCLLQARNAKGGVVGREVNSNGRHQEVGASFALDAERLARWVAIGEAQQ